MVGAAALGLNDAQDYGIGHGMATYAQTVTDLASDFFSLAWP